MRKKLRAPTFATDFAEALPVKESFGWQSRAQGKVEEGTRIRQSAETKQSHRTGRNIGWRSSLMEVFKVVS